MNVFYKTKRGTCINKTPKFHVHESINDQLLLEVLMNNEATIDEGLAAKQDLQIMYDFGYPIGASMCVECPPKSTQVYFKVRESRPYQSRMVHGALPQETSCVTVILKPDKKYLGALSLTTAWAGFPSKPELGNITFFENASNPMEAVAESAAFWLNHALIDEHPTAQDLLSDIKVITERLGLNFNELTFQQLSSIISARLVKNVSIPEWQSEDELLEKLNELLQY